MEDNDDPESWKAWFRQHGPKLMLCARQWTRSRADAEDVVQDAFVRFWRTQKALGGDPLALLVTSVRRAAFDLARRGGRRQRREDASQGPDTLFEPLVQQDDRREAIEGALARLPVPQREVLVLKIWGGLTFEEIAVQLDVPANTAASRYRYALEALKTELTAPCLHG